MELAYLLSHHSGCSYHYVPCGIPTGDCMKESENRKRARFYCEKCVSNLEETVDNLKKIQDGIVALWFSLDDSKSRKDWLEYSKEKDMTKIYKEIPLKLNKLDVNMTLLKQNVIAMEVEDA